MSKRDGSIRFAHLFKEQLGLRTFYQMVGMAPSVLMRGDFVEIPSPFNTLPGNMARPRFPRPVE